jgi:hypothetical protein
MEEKLIDMLINTVNRIETKIDTIKETMVTKEDCMNSQKNCPLKSDENKLKSWIEIIKESKLLLVGVGATCATIIKLLWDIA